MTGLVLPRKAIDCLSDLEGWKKMRQKECLLETTKNDPQKKKKRVSNLMSKDRLLDDEKIKSPEGNSSLFMIFQKT